jgi:hypothetical protein
MPIHISPSRPRHHVGLRGSPTATIPSRAPADLPPVIKIYLNGLIEEVQKSFQPIMSPEIPHNQCHYFIAGSRTSLWRPRGSLMVVRVSRRCAQGGLIGPRKPSCKLRPRSLGRLAPLCAAEDPRSRRRRTSTAPQPAPQLKAARSCRRHRTALASAERTGTHGRMIWIEVACRRVALTSIGWRCGSKTTK